MRVRSEYRSRTHRRNMAGDGSAGLRLSVYSPLGRAEEAQNDESPIVMSGHRLVRQGRAGDGGERWSGGRGTKTAGVRQRPCAASGIRPFVSGKRNLWSKLQISPPRLMARVEVCMNFAINLNEMIEF